MGCGECGFYVNLIVISLYLDLNRKVEKCWTLMRENGIIDVGSANNQKRFGAGLTNVNGVNGIICLAYTANDFAKKFRNFPRKYQNVEV